MAATDRTLIRLAVFIGAGLAMAAGIATAGSSRLAPQGQRVILRLSADSGAVGHYKFTTRDTHRLAFDLPSDDPRAALLESATAPRRRTTEIAVTMVSLSEPTEADRRYMLYWLGYRVSGDDVRSLSSMQWDSIFQAAGRRAVLSISPLGEPRGVRVGSEAVRPVGQAMADIFASLALGLPADSVGAGDTWETVVSIPVRRPDGSRVLVPITVSHLLRRLSEDREGLMAQIEFDGEPLDRVTGAEAVSGSYSGEGVFAVREGRYERMVVTSRLEVKWSDSGGLPPSSSLVEWESEFIRSRGG